MEEKILSPKHKVEGIDSSDKENVKQKKNPGTKHPGIWDTMKRPNL